jgi:hypothetical protein
MTWPRSRCTCGSCRALAPHPSLQPHRADLRGDSPTHQGHRSAPRRDQLPGPGLGGPGSRQPRLARPDHKPQGTTAAAGPAPPTPAPTSRGGDRPGCHRRRVTSPRACAPSRLHHSWDATRPCSRRRRGAGSSGGTTGSAAWESPAQSTHSSVSGPPRYPLRHAVRPGLRSPLPAPAAWLPLASSSCCCNQQTAWRGTSVCSSARTVLSACIWFVALMEPGAAHTRLCMLPGQIEAERHMTTP